MKKVNVHEAKAHLSALVEVRLKAAPMEHSAACPPHQPCPRPTGPTRPTGRTPPCYNPIQ